MHIPDSVLSPSTCAVCGAAMLPVWALAARRLRARLKTKQVPLLALGAAFSFTVMLFNIPALGGTTAHPVAGTLLAIALDPWAAVIGVSVALAIQALFFGDGGLLAYGANCFTMAFVLPFVGASIYRLLLSCVGRYGGDSTKHRLAHFCAGIGAFIGLNAAAAMVALLLGLQPALFHEANGHALYFPFGLNITLPAMLGTHLVIAGPAEAVVTALVVLYLQKARLPLYGLLSHTEEGKEPLAQRGWKREPLWIGLLALVALSPLGLLATGEAWGEWDSKGIAEQTEKIYGPGHGYVPKQMAETEAKGYQGLGGLKDYAQPEEGKSNLGYLFAATMGATTIVALLLVSGRLLARREDEGRKEPLSPSTALEAQRHREIQEREEGREGKAVLPDWMRRSSDETVLQPEENGKKPNRFLEKTLAELATNGAETLNGQRWARNPGYLQKLDPRAKLIAFLGLIAVVASIHTLGTLLSLVALTMGLTWMSRLSVGMLLKRVWLSVPIFVVALALPAALNLVTPGREILILWSHPHLAITAPGLLIACTLVLRVGVAVSFATLLTLTTTWNDLLLALRSLWIPRLFVSILAMTYRYVVVLLQSASEMFVARRSRTVGRATNAEGRKFVGASIGALFGKTLALSEEVHSAMLSRGFQGEMRSLTELRWRRGDWAWTLAMLLVAVIAFGSERL